MMFRLLLGLKLQWLHCKCIVIRNSASRIVCLFAFTVYSHSYILASFFGRNKLVDFWRRIFEVMFYTSIDLSSSKI